MRKKILRTILIAVVLAMSTLAFVQYVQEISFVEEQFLHQGEVTLELITPLATRGIRGANKMIIGNAGAKALYAANKKLLYLKMVGMSDATPKSDFSDAVPPRHVEYTYTSSELSEKERTEIVSIREKDFINKEVLSGKGRLYLKEPLKLKNGGTLFAVFEVNELKVLWVKSLGKTLLLMLIILGLSGRYAWKESIKLEADFINKDELLKITQKLRKASVQVKDFSTIVTKSSETLTDSFVSQESAISETTQTLEGIKNKIQANLQAAEESHQFSDEMIQNSESGNTSVQELVAEMDLIKQGNEEIRGLVSLINNIAEKTQLIDDITFQTKLLSFNASVEAARAGEHGKGFAVVAEEMSSLAEITSKSSGEISDIVKKSKDTAEKITAENGEKVELGMKRTQITAEIFQTIMKGTQILQENGQKILDASREQSVEIDEINEAMSEVNKLTQANNDQVLENSKLGTELNDHSVVIDTLVDNLFSLLNISAEEESSVEDSEVA